MSIRNIIKLTLIFEMFRIVCIKQIESKEWLLRKDKTLKSHMFPSQKILEEIVDYYYYPLYILIAFQMKKNELDELIRAIKHTD